MTENENAVMEVVEETVEDVVEETVETKEPRKLRIDSICELINEGGEVVTPAELQTQMAEVGCSIAKSTLYNYLSKGVKNGHLVKAGRGKYATPELLEALDNGDDSEDDA